jgi:predicted nucleotidyltransferase
MAKRKFIRTISILKDLTRQKGVDVDKIVVFGSYARGEEKKGSDIDIIIVSRNFEGKDIFERVEIASGLHRELVEKTMMPADIMYYSPTEWGKGNSLIINQAKEEGIVYT